MREQCIELKYQLRQVETLKVDLAAAECLAEQRREACEIVTRELFAMKSVNDTLRLHGQHLLDKVSMRATQPRKIVPTVTTPQN